MYSNKTLQDFRSDDALQYRAATREFPPGNSREFPEIFHSRWFPGIFSISREISGNFYILWVKNSSISLNFADFSLGLESNFTVKIDSIKAENHCNTPNNCIFFQKWDVFG